MRRVSLRNLYSLSAGRLLLAQAWSPQGDDEHPIITSDWMALREAE
jgi:hypothetical protein